MTSNAHPGNGMTGRRLLPDYMHALSTFGLVALLFSGLTAYGADPSSAPGKTVNAGEPMPSRMAKPGMTIGDVRKAAEKKDREMKAMMEKEAAKGKKQ